MQEQLVKVELPAGESEFVGHKLHVDDPVNALYFDAMHAVHVPPSRPE